MRPTCVWTDCCLPWWIAGLLGWCLPTCALGQAARPLDFAHDVAPLFRAHCGKCHTGEQKKGGLSLNSRADVLSGGESGPAVTPGKHQQSELMRRILSSDEADRMPPEGPRLTAAEVATLQRWIDEGASWQEGFSFAASNYEPPLRPRRPELPAAQGGRHNPVDRIVDAYWAERKVERPTLLDDAAFLRRASLDLVGLLPSPERLREFVGDPRSDKRQQMVRELLADDTAYAEHWLTFWNDLLRNDYTGTGFITGGRSQITKWLYESLVMNKPYDQFVRELIAPPTDQSAGFIQGIKWRGEVSAGQTVEIQFAQSIGQALLGINLKCASCHDSFIDRWKLEESFGLAAVYAEQPLMIHRCDKPLGKTATAAWLFPEIGQIDAAAPQPDRLKQLARLMTHPDNGRFTRTVVNRLWHRLMGRGIVHPTDAMQTPPWSADLLDYLAVQLADQGYDLKQTLEMIATSVVYQSQAEVVEQEAEEGEYVFSGPRAKRLTAEQFMDGVWQLTGAAPTRIDAAILRGKVDDPSWQLEPVTAEWIWNQADSRKSPAGEKVAFRKQFELSDAPEQAVAVVTCDNSYVLFVNGQQVQAGDNWAVPDTAVLTPRLKKGENEILIVASNGGREPNAAALFCEVRIRIAGGRQVTIGSGPSWQWTARQPSAKGRYARPPQDWQAAEVVNEPQIWAKRLNDMLPRQLARASNQPQRMVRASLVKSNFLMRSLGRPNRDQIVTVRPSELTTLEAIDLSNGEILADTLKRGGENVLAKTWKSPEDFVQWLFAQALTREPTADEQRVVRESLGGKLTAAGVEDALWFVIMLPEFQLVR